MVNTSLETRASGGESGAAPLLDQAKAQAQTVVQQTQQYAGGLLDNLQHQIVTHVTEEKNAAADTLSHIAVAVRQTGQSLRDQNEGAFGTFTDSAAESVERFVDYVRNTELDAFAHEAEAIAHRRPELFLGGMFLLGVLAARFLKSSGGQSASATPQFRSNPAPNPNPTPAGIGSPNFGSNVPPVNAASTADASNFLNSTAPLTTVNTGSTGVFPAERGPASEYDSAINTADHPANETAEEAARIMMGEDDTATTREFSTGGFEVPVTGEQNQGTEVRINDDAASNATV